VLANDAFVRLLPRAGGGTPPMAELAPAELAAPLERAIDALRRGSPFETFEARAGARILASGLSSVGGAGGTAWVLEDVTTVREREEKARAEERLVDLGVLAAGIAHEVLNPLASIVSTAQLLDGDGSREKVAAISRHVDRIARIVRGVADLARPSGKTPAPVPLDEIVADAIARAREEHAGSCEVALDLERPTPWVGIAEEPMRIALKNLVANALDATGGQGRVAVRARRENGDVVIDVEDDGPGVPEADVERIFIPFFTTKAPGRGAGLGLPIAASIVRQHGGGISVSRANGKGARFTIRLPAAGGHGQLSARAQGAERPSEAARSVSPERVARRETGPPPQGSVARASVPARAPGEP
jgi:signal transduction histidine kinase